MEQGLRERLERFATVGLGKQGGCAYATDGRCLVEIECDVDDWIPAPMPLERLRSIEQAPPEAMVERFARARATAFVVAEDVAIETFPDSSDDDEDDPDYTPETLSIARRLRVDANVVNRGRVAIGAMARRGPVRVFVCTTGLNGDREDVLLLCGEGWSLLAAGLVPIRIWPDAPPAPVPPPLRDSREGEVPNERRRL